MMRTKRMGRLAVSGLLLSVAGITLSGCPSYGPPPATVPYVDLNQYAGLWYEIASNPVFFNKDLVGVTAEYTLQSDGRVKVVNKGYKGSLDGPLDSITGTARVVDKATNSKLAVRFGFPLGSLFEGKYWIVLLDDVNYEYAVVTDDRQFTLFILSRTPDMEAALFDEIVLALEEQGINVSRLRVTGGLLE